MWEQIPNAMLVGWSCPCGDAGDLGVFGFPARAFPVIEDFQFGEELGQLAGFEQVVGIARAGSECALIGREGFVDQQATRCECTRNRRSQRAMEVAEYQNGSTTLTSERNLGRILKVCAERFDRKFPLRGGSAKFCEGGSIAVDSNDRNAGCSRGERVAPAAAREVGDHAQLGRGPDLCELVAEEVGRRRSLRQGLNGHRADRR
jgi:hypothetical protein